MCWLSLQKLMLYMCLCVTLYNDTQEETIEICMQCLELFLFLSLSLSLLSLSLLSLSLFLSLSLSLSIFSLQFQRRVEDSFLVC